MGKRAIIKTQETNASVEDFLNKIEDETKRKDSFAIMEWMKKESKEEPKLWGNAIIGFGNIIYTSPATGREVEWFKIGFAPRKANISLYMVTDAAVFKPELEKLGKHKTGKGCIYINKLADVDTNILIKMIAKTLGKK